MNQSVGGMPKSATDKIAMLQEDITVDKLEEKRNIIHCPSPPPSMRSKKYFQIGDGGDRHGGI